MQKWLRAVLTNYSELGQMKAATILSTTDMRTHVNLARIHRNSFLVQFLRQNPQIRRGGPMGWTQVVRPLGALYRGTPQSRTEVQQVVDLQYLRRYSRNKVCVSALSTRPVRLRHGEKLNCKAVVAASNGSYSCFFGPFSAHGPTRCTYLVRE